MTAPVFTREGAAPAAGHSWIAALLACAAAIVCWSCGEDWRQEMAVLSQQLNSAASAAGRGRPDEVSVARKQALSAQAQREATEARLRSSDDIELVRATLTADLRRMCLDSLAANCVVRLAEDSLANRPAGDGQATLPPAGPGPGLATTLEALNIQRARATVSGSFQRDEPSRLARLIAADATRTWRVNGVVIRANAFEIDVERLILVTAVGAARR